MLQIVEIAPNEQIPEFLQVHMINATIDQLHILTGFEIVDLYRWIEYCPDQSETPSEWQISRLSQKLQIPKEKLLQGIQSRKDRGRLRGEQSIRLDLIIRGLTQAHLTVSEFTNASTEQLSALTGISASTLGGWFSNVIRFSESTQKTLAQSLGMSHENFALAVTLRKNDLENQTTARREVDRMIKAQRSNIFESLELEMAVG